MQGKTVAASAIENQVYKVFPGDLNTNDTVFGGLVMSLLDRIALVVAERHSGKTCVTVSVDALHFLAPAASGENLILHASLNRAWNTSMEIGIRIDAENFHTGKQKHVVSAYFTFVALSADNRPSPVPPVIPETETQKRRYEEAEIRRKSRIQESKARRLRRQSGA